MEAGLQNEIIVVNDNFNEGIDDSLNKKNIDKTTGNLAKSVNKTKVRIYKKEKKSYEDISGIKDALVKAVRQGFSKAIESLEYEDDPKKVIEIMKDLQKIISSRQLRDLQVILNGNIENLSNITGDTEEITMKVKGNGILSKMFGNRKD
jgi:hypothetical protein